MGKDIKMKLHFLGTGAGVPNKKRNVTSIILDLLQEKNTLWMIDCGEATQHQILHTSIKPGKVEKIFITHLHGDHLFGLPGFLSSRSFQGGKSPVTVYGPKGIKEFIDTSLKVSQTKLAYTLDIVELEEGTVFEEEDFTVKAKRLVHGIDSYGFRIIEKDKKGPLLVDKLKDRNIQPGPIYQKIKTSEIVTLDTGEVIYGRDFIGEPKKGKQLVIMGDTRVNQEHAAFIMGADVLVHEATFSATQEQLAHDYYHSTTVQAAQLAAKANVGHLFLTHISSRFQPEDYEGLEKEAQEYFPNTKIAKDFDTFELD